VRANEPALLDLLQRPRGRVLSGVVVDGACPERRLELPAVLVEREGIQKRAYVLADNKLALNAGWDEELLAIELQELTACDLDFDVDVVGFSIAEIDAAIQLRADEVIE
jgi:ParB-like chromosome segregation protein Spo0J